jgi:hypothetical protein
MGLDMYLNGHMYTSASDQALDDFPIKELVVEIGYWRKHPNLHGAMVNMFANGNDECQYIELNEPDLVDIIAAIKSDSLPETTGFFFGKSALPGEPGYEEEKQEDIAIFEKAITWVRSNKTPGNQGFRWVTYRGSW